MAKSTKEVRIDGLVEHIVRDHYHVGHLLLSSTGVRIVQSQIVESRKSKVESKKWKAEGR